MSFFFFNDTATTEIYTLSLHDALPIWGRGSQASNGSWNLPECGRKSAWPGAQHADFRPHSRQSLHRWASTIARIRSEEHTSELQSPDHLVCRLLLEKKKNIFDF